MNAISRTLSVSTIAFSLILAIVPAYSQPGNGKAKGKQDPGVKRQNGREAGELPFGLDQYSQKKGNLPSGLQKQKDEDGSLPRGLEQGGKRAHSTSKTTKGKAL